MVKWIVLISLFVSIQVVGQDTIINTYQKNTAFVEIFGNTRTYSINYDRLLIIKSKFKISGRIGISYLPFDFNIKGIPLEINTFWGAQKEFFEIGFGLSYIDGLNKSEGGVSPQNGNYYSDDTSRTLYLSFRYGYRYQKPTGGFFFKIGLVTLIKIHDFSNTKGANKIGSIGFGIGYNFKSTK